MSEDGEKTEDGSDKDAAAATEVLGGGVGEPATEKGAGDVRTSVDDSENPLVAIALGWISLDMSDAELLRKGQVGTVRSGLRVTRRGQSCRSTPRRQYATYLVPSLNSGTNRAENDCVIHSHWLLPAVCAREKNSAEGDRTLRLQLTSLFHAQELLLIFAELGQMLKVRRMLGNEGATLKDFGVLFKTVLTSPRADLVEEDVAWNTMKRVLNPGWRADRQQRASATTVSSGAGLLQREVVIDVWHVRVQNLRLVSLASLGHGHVARTGMKERDKGRETKGKDPNKRPRKAVKGGAT